MRYFFREFDVFFLFLRAVVNMPIQTLVIPPCPLLRKMIISQLELGPPVILLMFFTNKKRLISQESLLQFLDLNNYA